MKKLLLLVFLIIGLGTQAQTKYKEADIDAMSGNPYETLLTNVEYGFNDGCIQRYLQKIRMHLSRDEHAKLDKNNYQFRYDKSSIIGEEKPGYIYVKYYLKDIPQYSDPMTTQVEIWGDVEKVIEFYVGFWSRSLNFNDVKKGEIVSTRFLSDVATLSFPDSNTAKITVVTAKDR